jgi:hypothetical protein
MERQRSLLPLPLPQSMHLSADFFVLPLASFTLICHFDLPKNALVLTPAHIPAPPKSASSAYCLNTVRDRFCNGVQDLLAKLRIRGGTRQGHATNHGRKRDDCLLPSLCLRLSWSNSTEKIEHLPLSGGHRFFDGRGLAREVASESRQQTSRFRAIVVTQ